MAQYVPYIPEVFPETPLFRPDFNFFDRMMQRKQSMFEQGLSKARTAYTSVLTAPLTNKNNIPLRDQYVKDATESLKSLASADLSLPQNVAAAEGVFSPFWQDKFIMKDMDLTRSYQSGFELLDSWKNSSDPKVRQQYSGITEKYLMNGYEKLQNANRNDQSFAALERRKPIAFTNIESYLEDQAKGEKLEIKYDDPSGPYLVESINGQRSQKKYQTWAMSKIGNNFYEQFNVTGIVEREERAKFYQRQFPNMSAQEINSRIAKDVVVELDKGYQRRNQEVDVEIARVDSLISSIAKSNNPANQELFNNLLSERSNLVARKTGISEEYKYFDQRAKDNLINIVSNNPDTYFATLAKQRLAENWATGKAAIESKLVKENTAWTSAQNIQLRQKEYELSVLSTNWKRDQELWERVNPKPGTVNTKTTTLKDKDGNDINVPVGTDQENSIMYRGFSGIDITKTAATALDLFNKLQQQDYNDAHGLIFDQQGILGLAKNLGLNQEEIAHVATAFQKEVASGTSHKFTKEQTAASNKLTNLLLANEGVKKTGLTKITGPGTMRNALIAYAQDYFAQRNNLSKDGNDIPLDPTEFEALMRYMTGVEKLNRYVANESNRQQLMQKNVLNNPKYASLVVDRDGKKDLVTVSDVAKDMQPMTLRAKRDGSMVTFSKEDLARLYMKGELGGSKMGDIVIDGTVYEIDKFGPDKKEEDKTWREKMFGQSIGATADWNTYYNNVLVKKYGESSDFSKLIKTAQEAVVPDLLMYKGKSGQQGTAWTLYFMPNKTMGQGDKAAAIIDQALNMANADIYTASGERADASTMEGIRALLKSEKNMEDFIGAEYIPQGVNGQRTVRIVFSKPISEESKATIGNTTLQSISGKTFDLVLKEGATAPALDELPRSTGYQVYDLIARGKTFKSDPVVEASGFKFMVTPNVITSSGTADESPSYVTVDLEFNTRVNTKDPKTGKFTTKIEPKKTSQKIDLQGSNAKSPDEIVNYLYSLYYENMVTNRNKQQEYQTYINTAQGATSNADYTTQLRSLGLTNLIK